jgi:transposase
VAVGHRLLEIVYNVLKKGQGYRELGEDYLDKKQDKERLKERLLKRLEKSGVKVTVQEPAAVA